MGHSIFADLYPYTVSQFTLMAKVEKGSKPGMFFSSSLPLRRLRLPKTLHPLTNVNPDFHGAMVRPGTLPSAGYSS